MIIWGEGAHFALLPTACALLFGEQAGMVYGIAFSFGTFCQITDSILVEFIFKKSGYGDFYYVCAALSTVSFVILMFFFKEEKFC